MTRRPNGRQDRIDRAAEAGRLARASGDTANPFTHPDRRAAWDSGHAAGPGEHYARTASPAPPLRSPMIVDDYTQERDQFGDPVPMPTFEPFPDADGSPRVLFRGVVCGLRRVVVAATIAEIFRFIAETVAAEGHRVAELTAAFDRRDSTGHATAKARPEKPKPSTPMRGLTKRQDALFLFCLALSPLGMLGFALAAALGWIG